MESINGTVYFISDCHFGLPDKSESDAREKRVVAFLNSIENHLTHLSFGRYIRFLVEYKNVVPKDNIRFLGKLANWPKGVSHLLYFG